MVSTLQTYVQRTNGAGAMGTVLCALTSSKASDFSGSPSRQGALTSWAAGGVRFQPSSTVWGSQVVRAEAALGEWLSPGSRPASCHMP